MELKVWQVLIKKTQDLKHLQNNICYVSKLSFTLKHIGMSFCDEVAQVLVKKVS